MRRRDFITGCLLSVAMQSARGQQIQRIALVDPVVPVDQLKETAHPFSMTFFGTLREFGYVEGRNIAIERYSGGGRSDEFSELARKVVAHKPDVIFSPSTRLIKEFRTLTQIIPIVGITPDPVKMGFVNSLAHPGGNYTGVSIDGGIEIYGNRLAFFKEAVPKISKLGFLISRSAFEKTPYGQALQQACNEAGISLMYPVDGSLLEAEYPRAFEAMAQARVNALFVSEQNENWSNRELIIELAETYRLPAMCILRPGSLKLVGS